MKDSSRGKFYRTWQYNNWNPKLFIVPRVRDYLKGGLKLKKKLLVLVMLCVVGLSQAMSTAYACSKTAYFVSDGDGDGIIEVGEQVIWILSIVLHNNLTSTMTDVVVEDRLAAELAINTTFGFQKTKGSVSYYTTGKSEKVHLTWEVGDLAPGELVVLWFKVYTDLNPAGRQEYTSPGIYELNSGPVMKFYVGGVQDSWELNEILVTVLP